MCRRRHERHEDGTAVTRTSGHRAIDEILRAWTQEAAVSEKLDKLVTENPVNRTADPAGACRSVRYAVAIAVAGPQS